MIPTVFDMISLQLKENVREENKHFTSSFPVVYVLYMYLCKFVRIELKLILYKVFKKKNLTSRGTFG